MEWSLFYTETKSTTSVFEGSPQTLNCKTELLMLKYGLMLSVAETWGEKRKENTEYWHENENFTSAMYTCHIFKTDPPFFSADDMKRARKAFREHRPPPRRSLLLPLGIDPQILWSSFLFELISAQGRACPDLGLWSLSCGASLHLVLFFSGIYILFKIICSFRLLQFWTVCMLVYMFLHLFNCLKVPGSRW